jgi:chorismate-pyruvate lyase
MDFVAKEINEKFDYSSGFQVSKLLNETLLKSSEKNKKLSQFQKVLLITNGSITELLEHYTNETIKLEKLYEENVSSFDFLPNEHKALIEKNTSEILLRRVLLQGKLTLNNYLYAESSILLDNLPSDFREDLLASKLPIGKLWAKYRFETYKTDFSIKQEIADEYLAEHLKIKLNDDILSRTYSIYSRGKKTMVITEKFSTASFVD